MSSKKLSEESLGDYNSQLSHRRHQNCTNYPIFSRSNQLLNGRKHDIWKENKNDLDIKNHSSFSLNHQINRDKSPKNKVQKM